MVKLIRDFSYIVTDNELKAFILEASLIKQHKPNFNIILRDDKNYPYIKLTIAEAWPKSRWYGELNVTESLLWTLYTLTSHVGGFGLYQKKFSYQALQLCA